MKKYLKSICIHDEFIILGYLFISVFMLMLYLNMTAFRCDEFDFAIYKDVYMYYMIFQFIVFSISIVHVGTEKYFGEVMLLCLMNIPLIFIISISGSIEVMNFAIVLFIQCIFGLCVVSLKELLLQSRRCFEYAEYMVHFVVFFVNFLSLAFLYIYYKYSNIVITTFYDKRIPTVFFLNPLLTISGYINTEITGYTQLGILPVIWCSTFWGGVLSINILLSIYVRRKTRRA